MGRRQWAVSPVMINNILELNRMFTLTSGMGLSIMVYVTGLQGMDPKDLEFTMTWAGLTSISSFISFLNYR